METIKCVPRQWGNSLGITIPKDLVEKEGIEEGKPITITLNPRPELKSIFASFKFSQSPQMMKDEERKQWQ